MSKTEILPGLNLILLAKKINRAGGMGSGGRDGKGTDIRSVTRDFQESVSSLSVAGVNNSDGLNVVVKVVRDRGELMRMLL